MNYLLMNRRNWRSSAVVALALLLIGVSLGVPIGARYASGYKNALCPTQVIVRPAHGVMT